MILSNFSFDLLSSNLSKKPVAFGKIIQQGTAPTAKDSFLIKIESGAIYEGEFIRTEDLVGTVKKTSSTDLTNKQMWIEIETSASTIRVPSHFEVFSTINILNISLLIELILILIIFYLNFYPINKWLGKLTLIALVICVLFWIYRNVVLNNLYTYSGFYYGGTSILIILFALIFFYYQLNRPENPFIYTSPAFWTISALLIYKAGTLFLFLYGNTLEQDEKANFFIINTIFYIIENLLFTIAFLVRGKKHQPNIKKI